MNDRRGCDDCLVIEKMEWMHTMPEPLLNKTQEINVPWILSLPERCFLHSLCRSYAPRTSIKVKYFLRDRASCSAGTEHVSYVTPLCDLLELQLTFWQHPAGVFCWLRRSMSESLVPEVRRSPG
jgi:hypothetical protein